MEKKMKIKLSDFLKMVSKKYLEEDIIVTASFPKLNIGETFNCNDKLAHMIIEYENLRDCQKTLHINLSQNNHTIIDIFCNGVSPKDNDLYKYMEVGHEFYRPYLVIFGSLKTTDRNFQSFANSVEIDNKTTKIVCKNDLTQEDLYNCL